MAVIMRSNYQELIPELKEQIKTATFVCFDAEYSGLQHPPEGSATSLFDTGADRYKKMRGIVMHNTAPQVGFCIFRRDSDTAKNLYHVEAYQAYVLEPSFGDFRTDEKALSLEHKCGKFLRKCRFDFNALTDHSVPCLNQNRATELRQYLNTNPDFMQLKGRYFDKTFFPEVKELFNDAEKDILIQRLRGLSEIVDVITEYQIPLVGHNFALDLLYFFRLFCSDLPESYENFKKSVSKVLPQTYDTKYMTVSCRNMLNHPAFKDNNDRDNLQSSSLYTAFLNTSSINDQFKPEIQLGNTCLRFKKSIHLGKQKDLEEEKNLLVHDPAFDACVTGHLFLNVGHISARIDKNPTKDKPNQPKLIPNIIYDYEFIFSFLNRKLPTSVQDLFINVQAWKDQIYIARATIITMCLKGTDPKPSRPQWIQVSSKEKIHVEDLRVQLAIFGAVDIEQADERTLRLAAAGGKSAKQMKKLLESKGLTVEKVEIPWDKQRYMQLGGRLQSDKVYDRSKMLG